LLLAAALYRRSEKTGLVLSRSQVWVIGFGLFAAQLIALQVNFRRYLAGLNPDLDVNDKIEWWWVEQPSTDTLFWFSPNYVWIVGSLAFGLFLIAIWKLRVELGLPGTIGKTDPDEDVPIELSEAAQEGKFRKKRTSIFFRRTKPGT
jgi:hypothetical protein